MFKLKKRVKLLEEGEYQDLMIMNGLTDRLKSVENDIELIMDYLDVEKETINDTFLTERQPEDYCCCGDNEDCPNCE